MVRRDRRFESVRRLHKNQQIALFAQIVVLWNSARVGGYALASVGGRRLYISRPAATPPCSAGLRSRAGRAIGRRRLVTPTIRRPNAAAESGGESSTGVLLRRRRTIKSVHGRWGVGNMIANPGVAGPRIS